MHSSTRIVAAAAAIVVGFICTKSNTASARPPVSIRTGANTAADGYLEVLPDEYGAWAQPFATGGFGPNGDRFKPVGSTLQPVAFTSGFFLFAPGAQRELLTDNLDWQATTNGTTGAPPFSADTSLNRAVTAPNVASDSNGDGINDTLQSSFRVFAPPTSPGTDLGFALRQRVASGPTGVAFIQQTYTVTNNGTAPITIQMVRSFDGDLIWDNNFETDSVGTNTAGSAGGPSVFEKEPTSTSQAVTLSIPGGGSYYGGKHGVVPPNGPPNFDFGTDTEVWDNNGTPVSWRNLIAGVGYNTNGESGPSPIGSTVQRDGFMGLDISMTLPVGGSSTFNVFHTYGSTLPIPEPTALGALALGGLMLRRRRTA